MKQSVNEVLPDIGIQFGFFIEWKSTKVANAANIIRDKTATFAEVNLALKNIKSALLKAPMLETINFRSSVWGLRVLFKFSYSPCNPANTI